MSVYTRSHQKGFTLLETLVAVFILTLALTGPIYIASLAIRGSVESRDNISAYHLAEEAIEAIRNKRDEISLQTSISPANWLYGITGGVGCINPAVVASPVKCYMTRDATTGDYSFTVCNDGEDCPPLLFNPTGAVIYGQTGLLQAEAASSKFIREVYLQVAPQDGATDVNALREVDVYVTIKWQDRGRQRSFQIVETLHNQQYAKYYLEDTI